MYNSDFNYVVNRFWLSHASSACVCRQVLAYLGASNPYVSTESRGETCYPFWALAAFRCLADRRYAGGNGAVEPAPAFTWRENPLRFAYLCKILKNSLKVHIGTIANQLTPQQSVIIAPA